MKISGVSVFHFTENKGMLRFLKMVVIKKFQFFFPPNF